MCACVDIYDFVLFPDTVFDLLNNTVKKTSEKRHGHSGERQSERATTQIQSKRETKRSNDQNYKRNSQNNFECFSSEKTK